MDACDRSELSADEPASAPVLDDRVDRPLDDPRKCLELSASPGERGEWPRVRADAAEIAADVENDARHSERLDFAVHTPEVLDRRDSRARRRPLRPGIAAPSGWYLYDQEHCGRNKESTSSHRRSNTNHHGSGCQLGIAAGACSGTRRWPLPSIRMT